jgi:hypothetical protein
MLSLLFIEHVQGILSMRAIQLDVRCYSWVLCGPYFELNGVSDTRSGPALRPALRFASRLNELRI